MSMIRQIWLLLLGTLALALLASVSVNLVCARDAMQTQLRLKNSDNATSLALVLSQLKGQRDVMEMTASAQFDTGFYSLIRFIGADGQVVFQRRAPATPVQAPAWFIDWFAVESEPGIAQVSDGWRALGSVEVVSQAAYAYDELWRASVRGAWALALVGALAGLIGAWGVTRMRRPLDAMVAQADMLRQGTYQLVVEPRVPELGRLAHAMNAMVERLRLVFETQSAHVESLRRAASCDAMTGLSNRTHFFAQLRAALQREDGHAAEALVLLRLPRLAEINQVLGRESTDRLIVAVAQVLQDYAKDHQAVCLGRLNGSDFALVLPAGHAAIQSARAVVERLRSTFSEMPGSGSVVAGVVEARHGMAPAELMGAADLALAQAECAGPYAVEAVTLAGASWALFGEQRWREHLIDALAHGRVRLGEFAVIDAQRGLIHLECPMRLQLDPEGPFEVAAHWLPLAVRSHMSCQMDERAVALALQAIAIDGQQRSVNLSPSSLLDSGFTPRLRAILQAAPSAARQLWMEINESAAVDHFDLLRELVHQLRPSGVRFGIEHAGERLNRIDRLFEAGLDFVKLDAAVTHGVNADRGRASFVKGLVMMLHGLSLNVIAEGVGDALDAQALWACGIDGVTGPWVSTVTAARHA